MTRGTVARYERVLASFVRYAVARGVHALAMINGRSLLRLCSRSDQRTRGPFSIHVALPSDSRPRRLPRMVGGRGDRGGSDSWPADHPAPVNAPSLTPHSPRGEATSLLEPREPPRLPRALGD